MGELKVYMASGWFHESDERILTKLENYLRAKDNIKPYFPRHDGVKLKAGEFHDPKLRKKVFMDNLHHIEEADFLIANLDGSAGFLDTGTCYEVGYAMAKGIPVVAYQDSLEGNIKDFVGAIISKFVSVVTGLEELDSSVSGMVKRENSIIYQHSPGNKVLFISPDNTEENISKGSDVANILIEGYGKSFRWVDKLNDTNIGDHIDDIFNDVNYMVAVIDDKHPIVSWSMGQAFARNIPIVSYTNYDWGVNLMLICSIVTHVKGLDKIKEITQTIKREGIESLDKFDNGGIKVF